MIDPAPFALTIDQARALLQSGQTGDDYSVPDNARPDQHVHVKRVGPAGGRRSSRVAVILHGENPQAMLVSLVAAPQARALAAALLNAADEIDGKRPLVFTAPESSVERRALAEDVLAIIAETTREGVDAATSTQALADVEAYARIVATDEVQDAIDRTVEEIEGEGDQ